MSVKQVQHKSKGIEPVSKETVFERTPSSFQLDYKHLESVCINVVTNRIMTVMIYRSRFLACKDHGESYAKTNSTARNSAISISLI